MLMHINFEQVSCVKIKVHMSHTKNVDTGVAMHDD